ncbi:hypothetical protein H0H81_007966 [Sphagnurus paluster]|uniref:F-box domain-containing protein n=1 Tax=Sphagnurus paluster TaxID=117069 RepID=A0A9P7FQH1_9AGAR|nr:hypothetical protein H0H81_007966 [Sphagnurus paluster]
MSSAMERLIDRTPLEIWFMISSFIPRPFLRQLYAVNRTFLEISAQTRYEEVTFYKFDKNTKSLCRILNDPSTGRGVLTRRVKVQPWLVQPRVKPSKKRSFWNFVKGALDPQFAQRKTQAWVEKRMKKDIKRVSDTVSGLENLSEYSLEWKEDWGYHRELYQAFTAPLISRIGDRLVKLSLNVPMGVLSELARINLPHLEHFSISLCAKKLSQTEIKYIFDAFVIFVNNLLHTLTSLSITSRVPSPELDLATFFQMLGVFPRLQRFSLCMPFDGSQLSDTGVVVQFLNKHRETLRSIQFTTNRCSATANPTEQSKLWIPNILSSLDTPYPQLCDVHIALRPLKADLTPIFKFLSLHSGQISHLSLVEQNLKYAEVAELLNTILNDSEQSPLRRLHLRLERLSRPLLEMLASRLPSLARLELTFAEVIATAAHAGHDGALAHSKERQFELFREQLRANRQVYASWAINTIGIHNESRYPPFSSLERILVNVIPGLAHFIDLKPEPDGRHL